MGPSTGVARAAFTYWRANWRSHVIAVAAGGFLAFVGALGTQAASLLDRLIFWTTLMLAGSVCAVFVNAALSRRPRVGENAVLRWLIITIGIATPISVLAWVLARFLFTTDAPTNPLYFGWASVVVTGAMTALMMGLNAPGPATQGPGDRRAPVKLLERLPTEFRGAQIYAVSAEDHYLRVHTSRGATLILLRLSDALAELDGIEGAQTHRSWWVARGAIVGMQQNDRRMTLLLKGDVEAPVSRPNASALRLSGWLPD